MLSPFNSLLLLLIITLLVAIDNRISVRPTQLSTELLMSDDDALDLASYDPMQQKNTV